MKSFQDLTNDPKKEKKALQALFNDPEQFQSLNQAQKLSAMQDYLYLCALDNFELHEKPGEAFALYEDMKENKQLTSLLILMQQKVPDSGALRQELEHPQLSFFASGAISDDIITAKKVIDKEMGLYREAMELDGLDGVHQMREAEQKMRREEQKKAAEYVYQQQKSALDQEKRERREAEDALRVHQNEVERTRKKGQIVAGAKDFDREVFKKAAYRNGWSKETDAEVLDSIYDIYDEAKGMDGGKIDVTSVKNVEKVMNDIMTIKGDIDVKYRNTFKAVRNCADYYERDDTIVFDNFEGCVAEQELRREEIKQKEQERLEQERRQAAQQNQKQTVKVNPRPAAVQRRNYLNSSELENFRKLSQGVYSSKWYMAGHTNSNEIVKLQKASNELAEALRTNSALSMEKLRDAYEASMKYQEKIRFAANVPYENRTWEPSSGFGKERYQGAKNIEAFAKKYLPPSVIKEREKLARHNDYMHRTWIKASAYTPENVKSKMMAESQNALRKKAKSLGNNQSAALCKTQIAQVLAVQAATNFYESKKDPTEKNPDPFTFIRGVDNARKNIMARPEFKFMLRLMTPAEAAKCGATKDGKMLSMKLADAKRSLNTLTTQAEEYRERSLSIAQKKLDEPVAAPRRFSF